MRIFQRHGGYMISYPLLTPCNDLITQFNRAFKVADPSGLVLCLPYNHRVSHLFEYFSRFFIDFTSYFELICDKNYKNIMILSCHLRVTWQEAVQQT